VRKHEIDRRSGHQTQRVQSVGKIRAAANSYHIFDGRTLCEDVNVKPESTKVGLQVPIVGDARRSKRSLIDSISGGGSESTGNDNREQGVSRAKFKRNKGLGLAGKLCFVKMAMKDTYGIFRSAHSTEIEYTSALKEFLTDRNSR